LPLLVLALLAAAPRGRTTSPESLLRAGDAAYRASDLDRAAELYDQAGVRTIQPSRAAFNLATAKYRLAQEGKLDALADAEVGYRSCLDRGDPYRARALFGLGNCLLRRADSGGPPDRATLRAAIDRFSACLADPNCDEALAEDARYNRARARLLLLQTPPPPGATDEGESDDKKDKDDENPEGPDGKDNLSGNDTGTQPKSTQGTPTNGGTEDGGETGDTKQGAGAGHVLPPVSNSADAPPLPPGDAAEHVERATRRILEEAAAYRRSRGRAAPAGVRDW
jgi:hypothetical protein